MNFCRDCKHVIETIGTELDAWGMPKTQYRCRRVCDPVSGEAESCDIQRGYFAGTSRCGRDGRFFEPKGK